MRCARINISTRRAAYRQDQRIAGDMASDVASRINIESDIARVRLLRTSRAHARAQHHNIMVCSRASPFVGISIARAHLARASSFAGTRVHHRGALLGHRGLSLRCIVKTGGNIASRGRTLHNLGARWHARMRRARCRAHAHRSRITSNLRIAFSRGLPRAFARRRDIERAAHLRHRIAFAPHLAPRISFARIASWRFDCRCAHDTPSALRLPPHIFSRHAAFSRIATRLRLRSSLFYVYRYARVGLNADIAARAASSSTRLRIDARHLPRVAFCTYRIATLCVCVPHQGDLLRCRSTHTSATWFARHAARRLSRRQRIILPSFTCCVCVAFSCAHTARTARFHVFAFRTHCFTAAHLCLVAAPVYRCVLVLRTRAPRRVALSRDRYGVAIRFMYTCRAARVPHHQNARHHRGSRGLHHRHQILRAFAYAVCVCVLTSLLERTRLYWHRCVIAHAAAHFVLRWHASHLRWLSLHTLRALPVCACVPLLPGLHINAFAYVFAPRALPTPTHASSFANTRVAHRALRHLVPYALGLRANAHVNAAFEHRRGLRALRVRIFAGCLVESARGTLSAAFCICARVCARCRALRFASSVCCHHRHHLAASFAVLHRCATSCAQTAYAHRAFYARRLAHLISCVHCVSGHARRGAFSLPRAQTHHRRLGQYADLWTSNVKHGFPRVFIVVLKSFARIVFALRRRRRTHLALSADIARASLFSSRRASRAVLPASVARSRIATLYIMRGMGCARCSRTRLEQTFAHLCVHATLSRRAIFCAQPKHCVNASCACALAHGHLFATRIVSFIVCIPRRIIFALRASFMVFMPYLIAPLGLRLITAGARVLRASWHIFCVRHLIAAAARDSIKQNAYCDVLPASFALVGGSA